MKKQLAVVLVLLGLAAPLRADLKVATLHPLLTDLARNVGGDHVNVVSLLKPGGDPHDFEPSPGDMLRIRDARIILASGKGLEIYLPRLAANLSPGQELFEVGKNIPSLRVEVGELFVCCPAHSHGGLDPHWWLGIGNMRRAARYLAEEFGRLDPGNAATYKANAAAYDARLAALKSWADKTLSSIPRADRELATGHAAFSYFCKEFGFRAIPVQGLTREREPSPAYLAQTIRQLRQEKVKAVFPEQVANPKVLASIASEAGVKIGPTLIADGTGQGDAVTFEGMTRHNVTAIASALN